MEYPFKDLLPLDEVLEREGYYKDWTHLDPEVFYSLTQISEYIKTKGYGVDVRLLISQLAEHFGLKTTQVVDLANLLQQKFEKLEGVTQSFTNNINTLVEQMEADKNAVIANTTVDSEVILSRGGFDTLGKRLDGVDPAVIGINVVEKYGVDNTGSVDVMDILASKMVDNAHLYFPDGTYLIGTHHNIENVKNLKLTFSKNAFIADDHNVPIQAHSSGGTAVDVFSPVGTTFVGCENLRINRLNINNPRRFSNGRMNANDKILEEYLEVRLPVFSFEGCKGLVIDELVLDGYTGASTSQYMPINEVMASNEIMKDFFVRFINCKSVKIGSFVANEDTGYGETIGFYKCSDLYIGEAHHDRADGLYSFWTLYKVIDCDNVEINNTNDVITDTPGSFVDVSGKNIVLNNLGDSMYTTTSWGAYALVDITKEWGVSSGNTENVIINNITADGRGLIETHFSSRDQTDLDKGLLDEQLTIDRVIINNAKVSNMPWKGHSAIDVSSIKNTTVNTLRAENVATLVKASPFFKQSRSNLYVNDFSVGVGSDHTIIQTNGNTVFENGIFYRNSPISANLYIDNTRSEESDMYKDLSSKVTFKNTRFENVSVLITSNIEFIYCEFYNVSFKMPSNTKLNRPIVTFTGGNIKLIGSIYTQWGLIDMPTNSPKELTFNGTKISGDFYDISGLGLIRVSQGDVKITMENVDLNVRRVTVDGDIFTGANSLLHMKNGLSLVVRHSKINQAIMVTSETPSSILLYNNLLDGVRSVIYQGNAGGFAFSAFNNMVVMSLDDAATKNTRNGGVSKMVGNHII